MQVSIQQLFYSLSVQEAMSQSEPIDHLEVYSDASSLTLQAKIDNHTRLSKHLMTGPNQLVDIRCKRGIVWGKLEFELPSNQVVRLHGTEWNETQHFFHYLIDIWKKWSQDMSLICSDILSEQVQEIEKY